ncbi:hypothetical protein ACVBEH_10555, partial [Roseateles sp. GG27B]
FTLRSGPVRVVTEGIAVGQTIQDCRKRAVDSEAASDSPDAQTPWSRCPPQRVCVAVRAERVLDLFSQAFNS